MSANRPVTKRDIIEAIAVIILMLVPYALREIYPGNNDIQGLFGGFKLLFYWALLGYLGWRFDKWLNKKIKRKQ